MSTTLAFVCVQNAGRSQMAAALAAREVAARDLDVTVLTGGTDPADHVHPVVVDAMAELGLDLSDARPRAVTADELADADVVVTMGCDAADVCPATWAGENRDWGLPDPEGRSLDEVRDVRDEVAQRVSALLDEVA